MQICYLLLIISNPGRFGDWIWLDALPYKVRDCTVPLNMENCCLTKLRGKKLKYYPVFYGKVHDSEFPVFYRKFYHDVNVFPIERTENGAV